MTRVWRITCLVDNCVASSEPLWAEHGLSFLIEAEKCHLLFDCGWSGDVLAHNLKELKKPGDRVQTIVLSHGHMDHTGGLKAALAWAPQAEVLAHPGVLDRRHARRKRGEVEYIKPIGIPFSREEIESLTHLKLATEITEIIPGVWATGEVPRLIDEGTPAAQAYLETPVGPRPDPVPDDQSLVLDTSRGLLLLLGCCHAGLLNTIEHVQRSFGRSVYALVGGSHLGSVKEAKLAEIAVALRDVYRVQELYLNHCSGQAVHKLAMQLGEIVRPCPVGTILEF